MKKTDSRLMRAVGWVLKPFTPTFMGSFWTTIGSTVYVPSRYDDDEDWGTEVWRGRHAALLAHEAVHVAQFERYGLLLMAVMYLGPAPFIEIVAWIALIWSWKVALIIAGVALANLPLSVGLAWGRWRLEREAYLESIRYEAPAFRDSQIKFIADTLWRNYLFTWPRVWVRKSLRGEVAKW